MLKFLKQLLLIAGILGAIYISFEVLSPSSAQPDYLTSQGFSTERAFKHVDNIAKKPHYIGSQNHSSVRNYIIGELQKMDLEVQTQMGYHLNNHGIATVPENILVKIEGSDPQPGNDLMVLTHYDSAVHSSYGASDAGSGVGVILEGIRSILKDSVAHKNNIVLGFTDAEEVGLNGAGLFNQKHAWADDIGLIINFEARGSGGPSNMILETNHGNANLVKAFDKADAPFPNGTSLMYSVYKKLPNDTDATVFREQNDIPGFFFAFIDDHFDYHTATDNPKNLDSTSLAHQATYFMAAVPYLANQNLKELSTEKDQVYFNFPGLGLIHYSYGWITPLLILAWVIFIALFIIGIRTKKLDLKEMGSGVLVFLLALLVTGFIGYFSWPLLENIYPQYTENLQGFVRNGQNYITAIIFISLFFFWLFYSFVKEKRTENLWGTPLFIFLILNTVLAVYLKGATYFLLPVFPLFIGWALTIFRPKTPVVFQFLLSLPAIFIFSPLIQFFPVGLGLKMLVLTSVFTVILGGLALPLIKETNSWIFKITALIAAGFFLIQAHGSADYSKSNKKPNSLVYKLNVDKQKAAWLSYDNELDAYTAPFFSENKSDSISRFSSHSKYQPGIKHIHNAPVKAVPAADYKINVDSSKAETNVFDVVISPNRDISRLEIFTESKVRLSNFSFQGEQPMRASKTDKFYYREANNTRLLTYYAIDQSAVELHFELPKNQYPDLHLREASYDLLNNPLFEVNPRTEAMMPKPFILNDAVITSQTINLEPAVNKAIPVSK